jgi:hypothetical protein
VPTIEYSEAAPPAKPWALTADDGTVTFHRTKANATAAVNGAVALAEPPELALKAFDPRERRDDHGRWADGGGVGLADDGADFDLGFAANPEPFERGYWGKGSLYADGDYRFWKVTPPGLGPHHDEVDAAAKEERDRLASITIHPSGLATTDGMYLAEDSLKFDVGDSTANVQDLIDFGEVEPEEVDPADTRPAWEVLREVRANRVRNVLPYGTTLVENPDEWVDRYTRWERQHPEEMALANAKPRTPDPYFGASLQVGWSDSTPRTPWSVVDGDGRVYGLHSTQAEAKAQIAEGKAFDPRERRDRHGRWTDGGGGAATAEHPASAVDAARAFVESGDSPADAVTGDRVFPTKYALGAPRKHPRYSVGQQEAVRDYAGSIVSYAINRYLRGDGEREGPTADARKRLARGIDAAMDAAGPLGKPVRVIRTVDGTSPDELGIAKEQTFEDRGFGSTTSDPERAKDTFASITMHLIVSPQVKALWGANPYESELLLERGVRYHIMDLRERDAPGEKGWVADAVVLPPRERQAL